MTGCQIGQTIHEARQTRRKHQQSLPVEPMVRLGNVGCKDAESGENSDYADWKINEEYPAPGKVIDQEAAQYRTEDGAQQHIWHSAFTACPSSRRRSGNGDGCERSPRTR